MKKLHLLLVVTGLLISSFPKQLAAQITIYSESFAAVTPPNLPGGWNANTEQIVTNSNVPSPSSGGPNLRSQNCLPLGEERMVTVSGISTQGQAGISVVFGHRKSNAWDLTVNFEWSTDGINWNFIAGINSANSNWSEISFNLPSGADNQTSLAFRWRFTTDFNLNCTAPPNYRIDDFRVRATTILPIELVSFHGHAAERKVDLTWQTQSETNNDYFQVEHSNDGVHFEEFDRILGAGESLALLTYRARHLQPVPGTNYYRLRQMDFDGNFTFSPTISVELPTVERVKVYPTTVRESVNLRFLEVNESGGLVTVFSMQKQPVRVVVLQPFTAQAVVEIADLPTGIYILQVQADSFFSNQIIYKI